MPSLHQNLIRPFLLDVKTYILDTLFPITCYVCGTEGKFVCDGCGGKLQKILQQQCIMCKKPSPGGVTHPICKTPYGPDGLISLFDYRNEFVSKIIIQGKYYFVPGAFERLAELCAKLILQNHPHLLEESYTLSPIPLHKNRLRWRGFNQSEVFCRKLSLILNAPETNVLARVKSTEIQKDLKREARIKNMESAFALLPDSSSYKISGKNFILIDDVTTTGSTLLEAVKVLKRNGAGKIWCLTIAKD